MAGSHDIQQRAVQLVADTDPVTVWTEFFETTQNNLNHLSELVAADPNPILDQIIANQAASSEQLNTAAETAFQGLNDYFSGDAPLNFPDAFQQGIDMINNGDAADGFAQIYDAFIVFPGLQILPLVTQLGDVVEGQFDNTAAGVTALFDGLFGPVLALIDAGFSQSKALGGVFGDLSSELQSGDLEGYFNTLLAAPATIMGGLLNGVSPDAGLLSEGSLGFFNSLYNLQVAIADAITPSADTDFGAALTDMFAGFDLTDFLPV
ncbi:hypothetical protein AWC26_04815 [Mycobacterium shimoidei]|nr:hypothetical protein BHQ16_17080 [Mycobacterium shimoidei]ORW82263.1 hypothetical protein AWC26_04815 [Mycobacterium shimoidei]